MTKIEIEFFFKKIVEDSIDKQLQNFFPKSTAADWKKIAMQETGGRDPFEHLSWRSQDDIFFLPYYNAESTKDLRFLDGVSAAAASAQQKRQWMNLPHIRVRNHHDATALALEHLSQGADGVIFDLRDSHQSDFDLLTKKLKGTSSTFFFFSVNEEGLQTLLNDIGEIPALNAALFWETLPKTRNVLPRLLAFKNLRALGITVRPSSPVNEIAEAITQAVKMIDTLSDADLSQAFRSICFSLPVDSSFLETASKIKALRLLWFQVAQAYGQNDYKPRDTCIHARVLAISDERYAPHENMLSATFSSMAAIAGGCDALTVESERDTSLFRRWSRNVSHILREESFFDKVADPLAGAYAADAMTDAIARNSWLRFQQNMVEL